VVAGFGFCVCEDFLNVFFFEKKKRHQKGRAATITKNPGINQYVSISKK
jgi:hypothetical protein